MDPLCYSTIHQIIGQDGQAYPATGCFNPWIGGEGATFAMPREGNAVRLMLSGKAYFAELIKEFDAATAEVMMLGWQINWDAQLAPAVRLYDVIYRNAKRGVRFYVMPWDDTNPLQTYDDQSRIVLHDINRRLGKTGDDALVHVVLSKSLATTNNAYFSHHQKCVIVDRRIAFVGGLDVAYGRYDDAQYRLKADADGRSVLNRYNGGIAWIKPFDADDVVDPDWMSGIQRPGTITRTRKKVYDGGYQVPYDDNAPVPNYHSTDTNKVNLLTLDETSQPRLPWQDVHVRIEGPAVVDLVRNFAMRWNIAPPVRLATPDGYAYRNANKVGSARVQVLRSAPANMRSKEVGTLSQAELNGIKPPSGTEKGPLQAMLRLIDNAAHFIYIENQFFVSDFGALGDIEPSLSPAGQFIQAGEKGISDNKLWAMRRWDDQEGEPLDQLPQNKVCQTLIGRIQRAIMDATNPRFHVYITLPVHSEGSLDNPTIAVQVFWTMQTLVGGRKSLLSGIRRGLKARQLQQAGKPWRQVIDDEKNTEFEDIPFDACNEYVTLLNLRNWEKLGERYVTEQVYVHSKLLVVDDRFALIGSANVNDRSLLGERDSELAVLVIDDDKTKADIGLGRQTPVRKFARELRMEIWKKLFGITGNVRPATHLQTAIEQPVNPASWKAIQKQARENAEAYERAFAFVPRNWVYDQIKKRDVPAKILPTWNENLNAPHQANWKKGNLESPMPFQPEFWSKPRHNLAGVGDLNAIKGFITALPVHWTERENIKFKFPTSLVVQNDRNQVGAPLRTAWDETQDDGASMDKRA